jgi:hypothetical protein
MQRDDVRVLQQIRGADLPPDTLFKLVNRLRCCILVCFLGDDFDGKLEPFLSSKGEDKQ